MFFPSPFTARLYYFMSWLIHLDTCLRSIQYLHPQFPLPLFTVLETSPMSELLNHPHCVPIPFILLIRLMSVTYFSGFHQSLHLFCSSTEEKLVIKGNTSFSESHFTSLQKPNFSMVLSTQLVLLVFPKWMTLPKDLVLPDLYSFQSFVTKYVLSLRVS